MIMKFLTNYLPRRKLIYKPMKSIAVVREPISR